MSLEVSHNVEHAELMDDFFISDPEFEKLPQLRKPELELFFIKSLFEFKVFPGLVGFFQMFQQIILNQSLDIFFPSNGSDFVPDINQGTDEF